MLIYNHNETMIKDYQFIRFMDSYYIHIEINKYSIIIKGEDFEIEYLDNNDIMIKGKIRVIECHETRV